MGSVHDARTELVARAFAPRLSAPAGLYFDHAVVLLMENHAICDILTTCGGKGPYETSLANASALATNDTDCVSGSLSNYFCLTAASTFGCGGYSGGPRSSDCTWAAWNSTNFVDRLVAHGLTWEAFMEGMPSDCYADDYGLYVVRHDPFVYFSDIATNASRCARVVPAGTNDSAFLAALNDTGNGTNFLWLTPNLCNDMHDCSVSTGDAYLKTLVTEILASPLFTTQRSVLYMTFDEPTGGLGSPDLYTVWAGPEAKVGYTSATGYNHTSLEKTLELNWGLAPLTLDDSGAANMTPFFSPPGDFTLSATPSSVAFTAGGSAASMIQATPTNKFSGTIALTATATPAGVSTACAPSSIAAGGTSTCTMTASAAGSYTVTVTGTSGGIVRQATIAVTVLPATPRLSANFTFTPSNPGAGQTVTFQASASGGVPPYGFSWDFGDGTSGSGPNVTHAFATNATFTVRLVTRDAAGNATTASRTVTVAAVPPTVTTAPASNVSQDAATLEGDLTSLGGVHQVSVGFWYGTSPALTAAVNVTEGTVNAPSRFAANISGLAPSTTYYAEAWAQGGGFSQGGITSFTTAAGSPPPLTAGFVYAPSNPGEGESVAFTSVVSGGVTPYTYGWSFGNGATAKGPSANESFAAGTYNVTLVVNDTSGQKVTATRTILVSAAPPPGDPRAAVDMRGTLGNAGWYVSAATLTFNATDPAGPDVWVQVQVDGGPWANVTSTVLLGDGSHVVRYFAEDGYGAAPQPVQTVHVYVDTWPPRLSLQAPTSPTTSALVQVNWTGIDNGSGIANYAVSVDGDDFESQGLNGSANVTLANGVHTITVRATDVAGNSVVENVTVQVEVPGASPTSATTEMVAVAVFGGALVVGRAAFPKGWHRWWRRVLRRPRP